jgi:DNA-binding response OmpR family regulator
MQPFAAMPIFKPMLPKPVILMLDDDDACVIFLRYAIDKAGLRCAFQYVCTGEAAIEYLTGAGKYADRAEFPFPSVMLLDLKMPGMNGFDFLGWKRGQKSLASLPAVVWSTADLESDRRAALALGAHSYIAKPMHIDALLTVAKYLLTVQHPFTGAASEQIPPPMLKPRHGDRGDFAGW